MGMIVVIAMVAAAVAVLTSTDRREIDPSSVRVALTLAGAEPIGDPSDWTPAERLAAWMWAYDVFDISNGCAEMSPPSMPSHLVRWAD